MGETYVLSVTIGSRSSEDQNEMVLLRNAHYDIIARINYDAIFSLRALRFHVSFLPSLTFRVERCLSICF